MTQKLNIFILNYYMLENWNACNSIQITELQHYQWITFATAAYIGLRIKVYKTKRQPFSIKLLNENVMVIQNINYFRKTLIHLLNL